MLVEHNPVHYYHPDYLAYIWTVQALPINEYQGPIVLCGLSLSSEIRRVTSSFADEVTCDACILLNLSAEEV